MKTVVLLFDSDSKFSKRQSAEDGLDDYVRVTKFACKG